MSKRQRERRNDGSSGFLLEESDTRHDIGFGMIDLLPCSAIFCGHLLGGCYFTFWALYFAGRYDIHG